LDRLDGFEWDVHNVGQVAIHDVTPMEVEQTVARRFRAITAHPMNQIERRNYAAQIDHP
jgi:hypothetical protein